MDCTHDGFHSGLGRYSAETHELRYVMTCDDCGQELHLVDVQPYRPAFDPDGNRPYLAPKRG